MHIVLDFDGTITTKDTVGTVASHAISFHQSRNRDISSAWEEIVRRYIADHADFVSIYRPAEIERASLEDEITFQRSVRPVELKSLDRVLDAGLFRDVPRTYFLQAGRDDVRNGRVELREGFSEYVGAMLQKGYRVSVISVNWSASFIRGVIGDVDVDILANETTEDGNMIGPKLPGQPGRVPVMATGADKLDVLKKITETSSPGAGESLAYMGDSGTDLECLVAAARGVVMSDSPDSKLLRTLRRVGVLTPHISSQSADDESSSLVWARNFREIMDAEAASGSGTAS